MVRYLLTGLLAGLAASMVVLPARGVVSPYVYMAEDPATDPATYAVDWWVNQGSVLYWCNYSSYYYSMLAFEEVLPGSQWYYDSTTPEVAVRSYTSGSRCPVGAVGCSVLTNEMSPTRGGSYLKYADIWLNEQDLTFTPDGATSTIGHELGHIYGLNERYDPGPPPACGSDQTVMDASVGSGSQVTGDCDNTGGYPTSLDASRIQGFYALNPAGNPRVEDHRNDWVWWAWDDNNWAESHYELHFFRQAGSNWIEVGEHDFYSNVWVEEGERHDYFFYPDLIDPPQPSGNYRMCSYTFSFLEGSQDWTCFPSVWLTLTPPAPPSVSISGSNGSGTVSWGSVSGAAYYHVHVGRWNGGSYTTVVDNAYDTASPYPFTYSATDSYHAGVQACNIHGCSDWTASDPFWVTLTGPEPRVTSLFLFGPGSLTLSDPTGAYMWLIGPVYNPAATAQEVIIRADVPGPPSGCSQEKQLVLPGWEQFSLGGGQEKWVLYRFRYECHSPAVRGTYSFAVALCVRRASQGAPEDCRGGGRLLSVR